MSNEIRINKNLYFIKGIMCILVVFIHRKFPGIFGDLIIALSRTAVPFFFCVSGYFLYRGLFTDTKIISKRIKRIVYLLLISNAFYFIWEAFMRFWGSGISALYTYCLETLSFKRLINCFFLNEAFVIGAGHLWYLNAILYCYIICLFLQKSQIIQKINVGVPCCLLVIHLMISEGFLFKGERVNFIYIRNFVFMGMPYVLIGYLIHKYEDKVLKLLTKTYLWIGIVIGVTLSIAEFFFFGDLQMYFGTIVLSVSVFILGVKYPYDSPNKCMELIGKKYSDYIYIIHWAVIEVCIKIDKELVMEYNWYKWLEPIFVVIVSILFAAIFYKFKEMNRLLKHKKKCE